MLYGGKLSRRSQRGDREFDGSAFAMGILRDFVRGAVCCPCCGVENIIRSPGDGKPVSFQCKACRLNLAVPAAELRPLSGRTPEAEVRRTG